MRWTSLFGAGAVVLTGGFLFGLNATTATPQEVAHAFEVGDAPTLQLAEVITEDAGEAPAAVVGSDDGEAGCWIILWWQSSAADLQPWESMVRVRGLLWRHLIKGGGDFPLLFKVPGLPIEAASDHPYNSNFRVSVELTQKNCNLRRRYRFRIKGKAQAANGSTRYAHIERDLYYPSSTGWTKNTDISLGYLDLCLADPKHCSRPYYPNGDPNAFRW